MVRLALFLFICTALNSYAQNDFKFDGKSISPGNKAHFSIKITDGDQKTIIPITVFHGINDGPTLGITAGVHGYEYAPILAGQRLIEEVHPNELTGTIILVQLANTSGFLARTPYTNPLDNQNLNRSFPGNAAGSITDKIAWYLSEKVIKRCDFFVDMHSGDSPEDLMPYTAYYQNDAYQSTSNIGKQMASHMGFDHVIVFKTTGKTYMEKDSPSLYCSAQAFKAGIPAVDIECGRLGIIEKKLIDKIVKGIHSLLGHLKMTITHPQTTKSIIFIENRSYQTSAYDGIFYPTKTSGQYVTKGMQIGYITDYFNKKKETIYAQISGLILYIIGTPPINKGETIIAIGDIKERK